MKNIIENEVGAILTDILDDYKKGRAVDKMDIYNQPDKTEIMDILDRLFSIVYPGFFRDKTHKIYNIEHSVYHDRRCNVPPEQTDLCCLKIYERIRGQ